MKSMQYQFLGAVTKKSNVYEYYSANDGYVYQFKNGARIGWFCSLPAWKRTMHQILA